MYLNGLPLKSKKRGPNNLLKHPRHSCNRAEKKNLKFTELSNSLLLSSQKTPMVNSSQATPMLYLESIRRVSKDTIFITGMVMRPQSMRLVHQLLSQFNFQVHFHCNLLIILRSRDTSLKNSFHTSRRLVFLTCQEVSNLDSILLKKSLSNQDFFMLRVRDIQDVSVLKLRLQASTRVMFLSLIMKTKFTSTQENSAMSMKR